MGREREGGKKEEMTERRKARIYLTPQLGFFIIVYFSDLQLSHILLDITISQNIHFRQSYCTNYTMPNILHS